MKNLYSILIFLVFINCDSIAQIKSFQLNIHHMLKAEIFELGKASENNLSHKLQYTRAEYYISEISIIHDGGQETLIEDLWVLADAADQITEVDLGEHDIDMVEAIAFHIGVDEDHNHLDPTIWPADHPLAPQFPSMHWGWASGYRFVALEGYGGENLDQLFQLHGLGDINYEKTTVAISSRNEGSTELIELHADYAAALENIPLNWGMIVHAEEAEAQLSINNFNRFVFSPYNATSSIKNLDDINDIEVFPNPVQGDYLVVSSSSSEKLRYQLSDLTGKILTSSEVQDSRIDVSLLETGFYVLCLVNDKKHLAYKKIVVE